jgi:hypothetical protein
VFRSTRFGANVPMIPVAACVGAALSLNATVGVKSDGTFSFSIIC